ncbi:unnamed protein product, partial [Ectocarpus sp. 6 AP-2014]
TTYTTFVFPSRERPASPGLSRSDGEETQEEDKEETNTAAGPAPIHNPKKALRAKKGTLGHAHATGGSSNTFCCCRGLCETCPRTNRSLPSLAPHYYAETNSR